MADTPAGTALTAAHRRAQLRIGVEVADLVARAWPLLDLDRLDASLARWLAATAPLVLDARMRSARTAEAYLRAFSLAETGAQMLVVPAAMTEAAREAVETSLRVSGPVGVKSLMASGVSLRHASSTSLTAVLGSSLRHALDGGRETVEASTAADPRTVGWRRIGDGSSCRFCRMLIGRGEVYSADTARFASHDHCGCAAEPAYGGEQASVVQYAASTRRQSERDKERVREFLASMDAA